MRLFLFFIFALLFVSLFGTVSFAKSDRDFFDSIVWDNMHGRSWIPEHYTDQNGIGTCWAFSTMATLESQYLLTRVNVNSIDLAELYLIENCEECWEGPLGCAYSGGNSIFAAEFLTSSLSYREESDCYPYSNLIGTDINCWIVGGDYSCGSSAPRIDDYDYFSLWGLNYYEGMDLIRKVLWIYGPVEASYPIGDAFHSVLIYGYDESSPNGRLFVKDSARLEYGQNFYETDALPINLIALKYQYSGDCQNEDGDDYCFWGIAAFHSGLEKPSSCDDLGCSREIPDCDDNNYWLHGCEFSCGNAVCEPWESCYVGEPNGGCFQDCYRSGGRDYACCGNGIFEEGEDCSWCPQDIPNGCPECSDRIDNDGDGLIDYQGYLGFGRDFGCSGFGDNREKSKPKERERFMAHHIGDEFL